jgi:hypothetical protein
VYRGIQPRETTALTLTPLDPAAQACANADIAALVVA